MLAVLVYEVEKTIVWERFGEFRKPFAMCVDEHAAFTIAALLNNAIRNSSPAIRIDVCQP